MPLTSKFGKPAIGGPTHAHLSQRTTPTPAHTHAPTRRRLSEDANDRDNPELDAIENQVEMEAYKNAYAAAREEGLSQEEAREAARKQLAEFVPGDYKKFRRIGVGKAEAREFARDNVTN